MDETITRSAGAVHGQEMDPSAMENIIHSTSRKPRQRNTLYEDVYDQRDQASRRCMGAGGRDFASGRVRKSEKILLS